MSYDVIRHAAISGPFKFMKVIPDAVYFNTPDGSNQLVIHMDEKYHNARGNDVLIKLRNEVLGRGRKATPDELIKAAKAYVDQFSSVKHSDDEDDPDILTDDDVEIIEAPYPENGKAQIPRRSFIYDDEDGYPQDYFEHHGILGMKWGVRRYQNADGSLTEAGRKRYDKVASSPTQSKLDTSDALRISKKTSSYQAAKEKSSTKKADKYKKKADSEFDPIKKDKYLSKSKAAEKEAEAARIIKEEYSKLYKDISEGSVKAGKDFVIQRDIEAHLLMPISYIDYYKTLENHPDQEYQMNPWIGGIRRTIVKKK